MNTNDQMPTDWREFSLSDLLNFSNGINADKSAYGHGVLFANVLEVITHEALSANDIPGLVSLPKQVLSRYQVRRGDILFNRTSETQEEVGLSSVYLDDTPIVFGGFVFRGRPTNSEMDVDFSKYVLRSQTVRQQIIARGQGGIRANIGQRDLKSVRVQLPERAEQRAIAAVLDDASRLIRRLEQVIAKKQAIKQGMMQQLLTGNIRLPGFTEPWVEKRMGSFGTCIRGVGYDPEADLSSGDRSYTIRLLRSNNVQGAQIDRDGLQFVHQRRVSPTQVLESGDVVICMANGSRALVGKAALFVARVGEPRYTFGAFMGALKLNLSVASPKFVAEMLQTHAFRAWLDVILSGSSINNLRPRDVEGFTMLMPELPEQKAIAVCLADADGEIDLLRARLAKAHAVKSGMMQQLLTGRARLPVSEVAS